MSNYNIILHVFQHNNTYEFTGGKSNGQDQTDSDKTDKLKNVFFYNHWCIDYRATYTHKIGNGCMLHIVLHCAALK